MLLWSILPGVILRAMPRGWHMPENMAAHITAHIIGEPTLWEAGARLMQTGSPEAWNVLNRAAEILRDNSKAIEKCQTRGTKEPARCTIEIRPQS
jgi:hypothetical protein